MATLTDSAKSKTTHQKDLDQLKEKDPEFYKFLKVYSHAYISLLQYSSFD